MPFDKDIMNQKKSLVKRGGVFPLVFGEYSAILNLLPRREREDAVLLIRLFKKRRRAKLTNSYLASCMEVSVQTVKNRLKKFIEAGLLGRMLSKPKRQLDGSWVTQRLLILLKPKGDICGQKLATTNPKGQLTPKFPNPDGRIFSIESQAMMFQKRTDVPRRWFAWLLRQLGATSLGFPLKTIYPLLELRADTLESCLWALELMNPKPKNKAGWLISELSARLAIQ